MRWLRETGSSLSWELYSSMCGLCYAATGEQPKGAYCSCPLLVYSIIVIYSTPLASCPLQSSGQSRAHVNLSFVWRHLFYIMALKNGAVDSCDEGPAIQLYEDNQPWKVARTIPQRLLLYFQVIFWSCWWLSRLSSRIYEQHSEMTLVVSMFVCELASTRYCGTT